MSELTNPHKFWGSYQVNNHSKTLYIRTRLHQMKESSFRWHFYSSKVGTLFFQRETNLVIEGYLAGLPGHLLIVLPFRSSNRVIASLKPRTFSLLILYSITCNSPFHSIISRWFDHIGFVIHSKVCEGNSKVLSNFNKFIISRWWGYVTLSQACLH